MPDFTPDDINIEPYEYVSACGKGDITELIQELVDGGYIEPTQTQKNKTYGVKNPNVNDQTFWDSLEHLKKCRDLLSIHEENYINNMAAKYKHLR